MLMKRTKILMLASGMLATIGLFSWLVITPANHIPPKIHGLLLETAKPISPFSLKSTAAHALTEKTLRGKWSLLFFGYTYCPDICPTTLTILNQTWQQLAKDNQTDDTQVIFVSVDPGRDSPERLTQYVHYFNQHFIGATGSSSQITQLSKELGVPFFVDKKNDTETNYLVDHGSMIIVVNPQGAYQAVLTAPHHAQDIATDLSAIKRYVS